MTNRNDLTNMNHTNNTQNTTSNRGQRKDKGESTSNQVRGSKMENKINLDYDWNSEYGDGDIPDIDKK